MDRRDFLKVSATAVGTGVALASGVELARAEDPRKQLPAEAEGLLYDSTLCIGCKACVVGCKRANNMPSEATELNPYWDDPLDLSAKTLNVIQVYKSGTGERKDQEENGHAFIKRQCMHCVDPGCVSACPASAMVKNPQTGVVEYHKERCIGCRYCMVGCPYNIPKFEWDKALPQIRKCELCPERRKEGKIPACAEACPTGATISGKTRDLLKEAKARLAVRAGAEYAYPLNAIGAGAALSKVVPTYQPTVFGEKECGGTQCLILSAVPAEKLGLPKLPEKSYASQSENLQHTLYKGMFAPGVLLAGLLAVAYRNTKASDKGEGKHHE